MKQSTNIIQNNIIKGIQNDLNDSFYNEQILTHHRNGMFQTQKGDVVFASIEPANLKCIDLPYKYNGHIKLRSERYLMFSSDNTNSEIGIANTSNCTYTKVVNNSCLKLNNFYQVTGFVRINVDGEEEVIFVDGLNSDRIINLAKIPYKYTIEETENCDEKIFTNQLDCEEIKLNPQIKIPCLAVSKKNQGNLPNGMYSVAIAYLIDKQRFTDYYSLTTPISINKNVGDSSLSLSVSNLDRNFDKYQILLVGTVNGITTNKIVGIFPTSQESIVISDWINENYQDGIPSSELTVYKKIYDNTGILAANSQYLMRADIKRKPKVNYQPQAFKIKAKYVVYQAPLSYYKDKGENIGYWRDENYNWVIRFFHNDGEPTEHFQIAGREAISNEKGLASGVDVFELTDDKECDAKTNIENWQVFNTAGQLESMNSFFKCDVRVIGMGDFGYHESTEHYPDNTEIFGENACKPIRYHRFPDECKVPRFLVIDGETYINILGVIFSNIEKPIDKDGNVIEGIVGYEILRSERDEANKTVKSRGIFTNMHGYTDINKREVAFSNFPFNSLEPNQFISGKQTYKRGSVEKNFEPLTKFYNDKFTYYTPNGNYFGRERLSNYFQIETEEIGDSEGYFEPVFNHPEEKLLTNFSFWVAAAVGFIESTLILLGKSKYTNDARAGEQLGVSGGKYSDTTITGDYKFETLEDVASFDIAGFTASIIGASIGVTGAIDNAGKIAKIIRTIKAVITLIGSLAIKIPYSIIKGALMATEMLSIIKKTLKYKQYAYQYNSKVLYTKQTCIEKGNKRRKVLRQPFYLDNGIHTVGDLQINNGGRNSSVFVEFEKSIPFPKTPDKSRNTITGFGLNKKKDSDITKKVTSTSSVYYVTNKQTNPNQYGSIENVKPIKIHNCIYYFNDEDETFSTNEIFGGDCIISLQSHLNKYPLFRQNLASADSKFPPGTEFDYRLYNNNAYTRYWFDSTEFNFGNFFNLLKKTAPTLEKFPNQKYNLDGDKVKAKDWLVENEYMYLYVNGVISYIAETDYNIAFRETTQEGEGNNLYQPHYSDNQTNLSYIFRSDLQVKSENFSLDNSYKFLSQNQVFSEQFVKLPKSDIRERNSISYSLPSFNTQGYNNWRYFLPINYFSFDIRDYGLLTGIHALDQDRVAFLFSSASPFVSMGRDQLETLNGRNVTIGDGGLFAQMPREMMHTDVAYGSNHDKYAFNSSQFGYFYVSRKQGKIFNFSNKLDEISRNGLHHWCAKYMPLIIEKDFPTYPYLDNPSTGVGYLISFDNVYETVYVSKRDYSVKDKFKGEIEYDFENNKFTYRSLTIQLGDSKFFDDASWTISYYTPSNVFQSWHDWHPDGIIQEERHFISIKDNGLWKHNERCDLYSNFYGIDYPYEIEFAVSTGSQVHILQSIEYEQEAYEYRNNCNDRHHNFSETFTNGIIYNSEGTSGFLEFIDTTNEKYTHYTLPKFISNFKSQIPLTKVENKFRFNEFRDYTADRGRLTTSTAIKRHIFNLQPNGYERFLNPPNIDFDQKYTPRIRHYLNKVWFSKDICNNINLITKFANTKLQISPR